MRAQVGMSGVSIRVGNRCGRTATAYASAKKLAGLAALGLAGLCSSALGQAGFPAVFVANNGNLEGSVTSFRVNPDGTLAFVQKLVIGARASSDPAIPGTNASSVAVSPDGKFLAIGHATSFTTEQVTIVRVNPDATMAIAKLGTAPSAPLDIAWLANRTIAVPDTSPTPDAVRYYIFDEGTNNYFQNGSSPAGSFTTSLALDPQRRFVFAGDSGSSIFAYQIGNLGTLTARGSGATGGLLALGPGVSPDGRFIYAGSGISGSDQIPGFSIDQTTGELTLLPGSGWFSGGDSPKQVVVSTSGTRLFAAHGGDASITSLPLDPATGALGSPIPAYDVGARGSLGTMAAMGIPGIDLLLFTDRDTSDGNPRGIFSARINPDGTLTILTERLDTQGITSDSIDTWVPPAPPCVADVTGPLGTPDSGVTIEDLLAYLDFFASGTTQADIDNGTGTGTPDGGVTIEDLLYYLLRFEAGC